MKKLRDFDRSPLVRAIAAGGIFGLMLALNILTPLHLR